MTKRSTPAQMATIIISKMRKLREDKAKIPEKDKVLYDLCRRLAGMQDDAAKANQQIGRLQMALATAETAATNTLVAIAQAKLTR